MNWILKNKKKSSKTLWAVLFLVFASGLFYASFAHAAGKPGETTITSTIVTDAFKIMLIGVMSLVSWIFSIAATLFEWAIQPDNISGANGILQKQAVKDVWIMVRDLLNMTFILVLLFAAFCTIFRVDKWNLKAVWLNVLINALLVNFSYPIARFFIDVSNVAFYYFVNNLFSSTGGGVSGSSIFAMFSASSGLSALLIPRSYAEYDISYLIAIIVFTFIMSMTLLVVAALFIVRLVALAMIVMFSPVGFVGYAIPSMNKYATQWWENLFSYSFFAPIMIFLMAVSLRIMEAMKVENFQSMITNANKNAPADQASWIANAALFAIPVITLWMGMGMAKKSGGMFASEIVGKVTQGGKWAANKFSGADYLKKNYAAYAGARKKRNDEIDKKSLGSTWGDKVNNIQDRAMAIGSPAAKKRYNARAETNNKDDIKKESEKHETTSEKDLHDQTKGIDASNIGTLDDKAVKEAAGKIKQAHSRGAEYESHVEGVLKGHPQNYPGLTGARPQDVVKAVINATMSAGEIAMERDREKAEKDALDKWIREEKIAHMARERAIVKEAEDRGKIKP